MKSRNCLPTIAASPSSARCLACSPIRRLALGSSMRHPKLSGTPIGIPHVDSYEAPEIFDAFPELYECAGEIPERPACHEFRPGRFNRVPDVLCRPIRGHDQVAGYRANAASILSSRSWPVTRPLRRGDQLLQRILGRRRRKG
jgi:hypothetical protein